MVSLVFLTLFPPFLPLVWHFLSFLEYSFPKVAEGLSHALRWVHWSWLEPAMSCTGQPQPLLTEATPSSQHLTTDTQHKS